MILCVFYFNSVNKHILARFLSAQVHYNFVKDYLVIFCSIC